MKKRHVGRPRDGDPAKTRLAILRAAEESFAASGFAGATTREVAAKAGVNVATLHYHFGNKERLYRAALASAAEGADAARPEGASPKERLRAAVESLWALGESRPSLPRLSLLHRLAGPAPVEDADPRAVLLASVLEDAGGAGALPPSDAARVVLALLDGALVAARNGKGGPSDAPAPSVPREAVVAAALRVAGLA